MTQQTNHSCFSRPRCDAPALIVPVDEFLADLQARKLSPQTVKKRKDDLRKLANYLDARGIESMADVDLPTLDAYRVALVDHGYGDSSVESALRATSLFFRFLEERGHVFENPARSLKVPKAPVILGKVLTEDEVKRLLAQPDLSTNQGVRDRALLELLYSTGIRRGEAIGLTLFDVHLDEATISVTGKGRKQRLLPLGKHAVKFLRLYMKQVRPHFCPKNKPSPNALWMARNRRPFGTQTLSKLISLYGRNAFGDDAAIDTHTIRRTCATHMLRGGAHPVVVAQMLGHSGLRSLSHYLRTTITDLQKSHMKAKPGK